MSGEGIEAGWEPTRVATTQEKARLFGDYSIVKARGRYSATCYRCAYVTRLYFYLGHTQTPIRQHVRDCHGKANPRRDARETGVLRGEW